MFRSDYVALRDGVAGAWVDWPFPAKLRPVTARRVAAKDLSRSRSRAPELAPVAERSIVRAIAAIGIALTVLLSITDAGEMAPYASPHGNLHAAILAASITIPLHVRHLIYGMRGERPPGGAWTLSVLAIVTVAGVFVAGEGWIREFSSLAVSALIVVPGRRGYLLFAVLAIAPLFLVGTQWYASPEQLLPGWYFTFSIFWRTGTQFVLLRLLAALRALEVSNDELEARAVVQSRVGIDIELRKGVATALQQIVADGVSARAELEADPARGAIKLRRVANESRRALADARRVVAGYREPSVRAELDAARALLEASGAVVHLVVADGIVLDSPDVRARAIIRSALAEALRGEPSAIYSLRVGRDSRGALDISVAYGVETVGET